MDENPENTRQVSGELDAISGVRILALPYSKNRGFNPYNYLLYRAIAEKGAVVEEYRPQRLLLRRWDIVHIHWPERLVGGAGKVLTGTRRLLTALLGLTLARLRGAVLVWTVHNLRPHERMFPPWPLYRRLFSKLVGGVIVMSRSSLPDVHAAIPEIARKPTFVIPHGHYAGYYPDGITRAQARAKLGLASDGPVILFFGMIRTYKNVPDLCRAFRAYPDPQSRLLIVGKPLPEQLGADIERFATDDPRVRTVLDFVPDEEVATYFRAADLVVLSYRDVLNSGAIILSLSFSTPVLTVATPTFLELRSMVGEPWIRTYEGGLTTDTLAAAIDWARNTSRPPTPPLAPLEWSRVGSKTVQAFEAVRRRSPSGWHVLHEAPAANQEYQATSADGPERSIEDTRRPSGSATSSANAVDGSSTSDVKSGATRRKA